MNKKIEQHLNQIKQVDKRYWIAIGAGLAVLAAAWFMLRLASLPIDLAKSQAAAAGTATAERQAEQPQQAAVIDPFAGQPYPINPGVARWFDPSGLIRNQVWGQVASLPAGTFDVCALHAYLDYSLKQVGNRWAVEFGEDQQRHPVLVSAVPVANGLPLFDCAGVAQASAALDKLPTKQG